MDIWGAAGMAVLLLLGIALFARAYFGGMRFGERLERRRAAAAQQEAGRDTVARGAAEAGPAAKSEREADAEGGPSAH